jgi:predicted lipase
VAGPREIDACLVGRIADGIVVAFRGTLPLSLSQIPTVVDWVNDFNAAPIAANGFPGTIHSGFLSAYTGLLPSITSAIQHQRVDDAATQPVLITGHSKGGAIASLLAWRLRSVENLPVKVVTFAAARTGTSAFATAYAGASIDHTRYEYGDDIVPHMPPSADGLLQLLSSLPVIGSRFSGLQRYDYCSAGTLKYIDEMGDLHDDDTTLRLERDLTLMREIVRGRFRQIVAAHSIGCGSGYMQAIAPSGVCP